MTAYLHTWIWAFSSILLCISSEALSGWIGTNQWTDIFRFLQRLFNWVKSQGSGWATHKNIHRVVPCVVLALCLVSLVLLWGEPSAQSEVLSTQDQVFIKDISVLCSASAFPQPWPVPQSLLLKKYTPTAGCCHHHGCDGMGQVMSGAWFSILWPNSSILDLSDQRESFRYFFCKLKQAFPVFLQPHVLVFALIVIVSCETSYR